jgi:LPS sulfotransferase NodH
VSEVLRPGSYAICTTPRSGSNFLAELLSNTEVMGSPREFLNVDAFIWAFADKRNLLAAPDTIEISAYLHEIAERFATPNGIFGIKLLFDQLEPYLPLRTLRAFLAQLRFVWLYRQDVVAQASSLYIAQTTDEWTWDDQQANLQREGALRRADIVYDRATLRANVEALTWQNARWLEFFSVNRVEYLPIAFEEVVNAPRVGCEMIATFCGISLPSSFNSHTRENKRQGDDVNERLAESFRAESDLNLARNGGVDQIVERGLTVADETGGWIDGSAVDACVEDPLVSRKGGGFV